MCVKLLGVTLDSHLTMDRHVRVISSSCFYLIRAIRHIRQAIMNDMAKLVACSLVGSHLDYANSALFGVSQTNIRCAGHLERCRTCGGQASRLQIDRRVHGYTPSSSLAADRVAYQT